MFHMKSLEKQIEASGVRIGDSCSIYPSHGHRKAFTLNRFCIDFISSHFRPNSLSMSYVELPNTQMSPFHYRLELDDKREKEGRFVLKTLQGKPFSLNGLAAKEAYVERQDRLIIDDNKLNFDPRNLEQLTQDHFEHPILNQPLLIHSDLNILIQGETGTGKTHLARKIHQMSARRGKFVAINLSSFNPQLIESELFGHIKGSFTGAQFNKDGAFHHSEAGTLFLDEIDSLPLELQTKLLTFLDSKKFRRVGDTAESEIKTRMIFASGQSLEKLVELGSLRKDFYFRLKSGHTMTLPSLRNEAEKIKEACRYFSLKNEVSLSSRLIEFYESLAWPGNLRQLFGHLEKKKILSKSTKLDFDSSDEELLLQSSDLMSFDPKETLISMKKMRVNYVKQALSMCEGNITMTSRKLMITEKTVRNILCEIS